MSGSLFNFFHLECDSQIDAVLRHNEKLEAKLKSSFKKIESLEGELITIQKQNGTMEDQLKASTGKLQNMKGTAPKNILTRFPKYVL